MEELFIMLQRAGIGVDLLASSAGDDAWYIGVRLRTFGKNVPKNRMILAEADTFALALEAAIDKAKDKRWESLDWSARPWVTHGRDWAGDNFGL